MPRAGGGDARRPRCTSRAVLCGCTRGTARSPWVLLAVGPALGASCPLLGMLPSRPGGAVPAACSLTGSPCSALAPCCLCSCSTRVGSRAKLWKPPPLCAGSRLLGQKSPLGSACAPCPAARALPGLGPALGQRCRGAVEPSRCPVCCSQGGSGLAQGGTRRLSSAVPRPCPGRGARAGRSPHLLALQSPGCTFNCCSKLELIGSASKPLPLLAPKSSGPPWSRRTRRARSLPPGNGQERGSAGQTAGAGGCGVATRGEPVSDGSSEARGKDLAEEVRAEPRPAHGGSAQPLWQGSRGAVCQ